ncbi:hypothetical protein [Nocardiopsis sp. ATB16-24]|uniref:hypothetical protein n=1 Tax=Nocardiopsis sp. ATB16-24 TaxID=3019555 RepID=UPI002556B18D|nr:hypothetical protein [Nocardiopsis sp. ATB16-24]
MNTYHRKVIAGPALVIPMIITSLIGFGVLFAAMRSRPEEVGGMLVIVAALIVTPLLMCLPHVRVRLSGDTLFLRLWPLWKKSIQVDRIHSLKIVPVKPLADFGGIGIRLGGEGATGLLMRGGDGVELTLDQGRRYVVVVPDAEVLARRITAAQKQA